MLENWLSPVLAWLGIGLIPFLILLFLIVYIIKS